MKLSEQLHRSATHQQPGPDPNCPVCNRAILDRPEAGKTVTVELTEEQQAQLVAILGAHTLCLQTDFLAALALDGRRADTARDRLIQIRDLLELIKQADCPFCDAAAPAGISAPELGAWRAKHLAEMHTPVSGSGVLA